MIIPAIDLMDNKIVRLKQGKEKTFESSDIDFYVEKFKLFPEINVIDLNAALDHEENKELVKRLCGKMRCNVGGGIRTKELAFEYLRAGAKHVIIGTKASVEFLSELPKHRVIVALDVKEGKVSIKGWQVTTELKLKEQIKKLDNYCAGFLITNIDVEGKNEGVNLNFIKELEGLTSKRIMVAGGIYSYNEVKEIHQLGFDQVIGTAIYTKKLDIIEALLNIIDFSKGLIPTIVQDQKRNVLMLAFSNKDSIRNTFETKLATYFSRSRDQLWQKGNTSGNVQKIISINVGCESNSLIYTVEQEGVACHKQQYTCFGEQEFDLTYLLQFLEKKANGITRATYTSKLLENETELKKKIIEEAYEVIEAKNKDEQIWEVADLIYFLLVYMAKHKITVQEILNELSMRHITGGLNENSYSL